MFVDVIRCVRSIGRTLEGAEWPLQRIYTLMTISKGEFLFIYLTPCPQPCRDGVELRLGVSTYPNSLDY